MESLDERDHRILQRWNEFRERLQFELWTAPMTRAESNGY